MRPIPLASAALALLALGACDFLRPALRGSGTIARAERPAAAVHRVAVAGGDLDVTITVGATPRLVVETDDNLLEHLVTETLGDRLKIAWADGRFDPSRVARVEVVVPGLDRLELAGAVGCAATDLDAERLELELAGACHLTVAGRADVLDADLAGACRLDAAELEAREARLALAGACHASVHATETLNANAAGACDVRYRGTPRVTGETGGVSSVRPE
jgi:hypothetical protein